MGKYDYKLLSGEIYVNENGMTTVLLPSAVALTLNQQSDRIAALEAALREAKELLTRTNKQGERACNICNVYERAGHLSNCPVVKIDAALK